MYIRLSELTKEGMQSTEIDNIRPYDSDLPRPCKNPVSSTCIPSFESDAEIHDIKHQWAVDRSNG
jgi:hypothetical protein